MHRRFDLEQVAPFEEGGGAGVFGIYKTDRAFDEIRSFTKHVMSKNTEHHPGCSEPDRRSRYPATSCRESWIQDTPGTGFEGQKCDIDINECVRGTIQCPPLSGCINLEGTYE